MKIEGFVRLIRWNQVYIDFQMGLDIWEVDIPQEFVPELRERRRCTMEIKDVPDREISPEENKEIDEWLKRLIPDEEPNGNSTEIK